MISRAASTAIVLACAAWLAANAEASSYRFHSLYDFCAQANCPDGDGPLGLSVDAHDNLFGVTFEGGGTGSGTLFELAGAKGKQFRTIHAFCCGEGGEPAFAPVIAKGGFLFGITSGTTGDGTLFRMSHDGQVKVLFQFCPDCALGVSLSPLTYRGAQSGRLYNGISRLYGTASGGSAGGGLVYQAVPDGDSVQVKVLHEFCGLPCTEGTGPNFITIADDGTIYGTTEAGGAQNAGVVFMLVPNGRGEWTETTLYQFCRLASCADGQLPDGPLLIDNDGNLIGTTQSGGDGDGGVLFSITPNGENSQETVLHTFCRDCGEGTLPTGGVKMGPNGDLFGATAFSGGGTIYRLSGGTFETLYHFCQLQDCADGDSPGAPLVIDAKGNVFGTTQTGGLSESTGGTVFELKAKR